MFTLIYITIFIPYRTAFISSYDLSYFDYLDMFTEVIYVLDIFFNFFTAYTDMDDHLVEDLNKIACSYLYFWFWIDFVSSFPYQILVFVGS